MGGERRRPRGGARGSRRDAPAREKEVADDDGGGEVRRAEDHVQGLRDVELEDEVVEVGHGEEEQRHLRVVAQRHRRRAHAQRQRPAAAGARSLAARARVPAEL
jgi:hypothetical protein